MRNVFAVAVAATLGLGVCQATFAADLPVGTPPPAAVVAPAPVNLWTGCYLGINGGVAWGRRQDTTSVGTFNDSNSHARGAVGGQVGCDYQAGSFVFGVRDLFDWADVHGSATITNGAFAGYAAELKNNWLNLLTGRLGYTVQPNWLLYVQGGAAWRNNSLRFLNPTGVQVGETSKTRTGWTVGGGSEWQFMQNWSVFLEYDYADFGTKTAVFTDPVLGPVSVSAKANAQLFLVGLNWRLGGY